MSQHGSQANVAHLDNVFWMVCFGWWVWMADGEFWMASLDGWWVLDGILRQHSNSPAVILTSQRICNWSMLRVLFFILHSY